MNKVAVVVLAGTENHADLGRVVNALGTAKEFREAGDEVQVIFDGAGTEWVAELSDPDHKAHGLYAATKDTFAGACKYCAGAFGVREEVKAAGVPLIDDYEGHPSLRSFIVDGYDVLTF